MGFSTIIQIVLLLLKGADALFAYLHDQGKIQEGEDLAVAQAAAAILARSKRVKEIEDEYLKMPIEDIKKELDKQGDFRD